MKERNILERESRIYSLYDSSGDSDPFAQQSARVRDSMWRIRHVLSERQTAWENSLSDYHAQYEQIMAEFEEAYLEADDSQDAEMEARLERFQYAYFGISAEEPLTAAAVTANTVPGVRKVAELKFARFQSTLTESSQNAIEGPRDIREAYLLFVAPHTPEGVQEAVDSIVAQRETGAEPVPAEKEQETLVSLLEAFEKLGEQEE